MPIGSHCEIAGGSVAGRHHALSGRNNQDAFAFRRCPHGLVAVVCDGCSGARHSEVGARLGAELLAASIARSLEAGAPAPDAAERARGELLARLDGLASAMGERERAIADCLLFTVVGLVVGEESAWSFAAGDGLVAVNGRSEILGPFLGNEPPYPGYALLSPERRPALPAGFQLARYERVGWAALGTDGAAPLAGELEGLCRDDRCFQNPDMVRRRLTVFARERRLDDDATLVLIRRRGEEGL